MTSEEIKAVIDGYGKIGEFFGDDARMEEQTVALLEIAYHVARLVEHAESPRKSDRWKCPHCAMVLTSSLATERPRCTCGVWMVAA